AATSCGGGYNRHAWGGPVWSVASRLPRPARQAAGSALSSVSPAAWDAAFGRVGRLLPPRARVRNPGSKVHKLAAVLPASGPDDLYRTLVSHWKHPEQVVLGAREAQSLLTAPGGARFSQLSQQMMYLDLVTYLPDDILVKLDRATMGVSLEGRVPMLDHRLVELAWRVPTSMKVSGGRGKWLLRQVLRRHVPDELVERPKMGFGLPIGQWLRGPLRPWAEDLLSERRLAGEGYLDPGAVRTAWARHLGGRVDLEYELWDVLMLEAWLEASRSPVDAAR
ncbi:MAG: asparagine synthetase B family protein, partial [Acidimicrobiales bacterium]